MAEGGPPKKSDDQRENLDSGFMSLMLEDSFQSSETEPRDQSWLNRDIAQLSESESRDLSWLNRDIVQPSETEPRDQSWLNRDIAQLSTIGTEEEGQGGDESGMSLRRQIARSSCDNYDKSDEDSHVDRTMYPPDLDRLRILASVVETCQNVNSEVSPQPCQISEFQNDTRKVSPQTPELNTSDTQSPPYDQGARRRMPLHRPEIRPSCDVHIIYDTDHVGADDPVQLVRLLEDELDRHGYKYTDCGRDCLPGRSTTQQQVDLITQADFVVCFISICEQIGQVSLKLICHVKKALTIKRKSGHFNRIIPVFCNMAEEQVREILDAHLSEMMLMNHIIARHRDVTYIEKVMDALTATPSEAQLVKVYKRDLPDKCCPLFRLEDALFIPRELIDIYLQPKCLIHEYRGGQKVVNSRLSSLTSIVEVTEQSEPGAKIIVSASAGLGKSAISSHTTRLWCHGQAMDKYKLLYQLLPRYIHRHAEPIERIICTDLKLHATSAEAEVRRAIKYNAENMAFIIDGYDEVMERDQRFSSLNKVISGEVAKDSKVVITTRPHCVNHLTKLCHDSYVLVELLGLTAAASKYYIEKMCTEVNDIEARKEASLQILSQIPEEARHVPLLLNMAVIIHRWNREHPTEAKEFPEVRTVSDVIGRVIAMFLSLQAEKDKGLYAVPVNVSPLARGIPNRHIIKEFARMCFDSIREKKFEFSSETLDRFDFAKSNDLSQLGFLEMTLDEEGSVESARCFHNQIMEYCAAMYVAYHPDALQSILRTFSSAKDKIMSESLGFWQDTLIFAVGINSQVLSDISSSTFSLRVSHDKKHHKCLDLSYEARLIHETESIEARERFCEALMNAPLIHTTKAEPCLPTLSSTTSLVQSLGAKRYLKLLKKVYGEYLMVDQNNQERGQLRGVKGKRILTGSMALLSCVTFLSLTDTDHLVVQKANMKVLINIEQKTSNEDKEETSAFQTVTHGVHHIQLADDVIYTSEQLTCLIRAVAPSTGLESVTLCCPPEGATDAVVYTHKVKKIVFKQCEISMADITSLTSHLDVEHIQMDDATLRVDGEDKESYYFSGLPLNLRCDVVFWLFMSSSTDGKGASRAVTTERDSVRAKQVEVTNSSVCKLRRLTSVIKMKELNIKGSLRDDRGQHGSPDDVTQVGQGVDSLNVDCRLSVTSLITLYRSVGRVRQLWLELNCELVDDNHQSSSSALTHPVCHVAELRMRNRLSLVLLDYILRLMHVDKLWLSACEVTYEADNVTSLPGISTLVLECVLGARALFDHIMSPGVRRVAVRSWHGVCDDEQDKLIQYTVPHTTLCHACPNAKVVYPKSGKDNTWCGTEGARRVNK